MFDKHILTLTCLHPLLLSEWLNDRIECVPTFPFDRSCELKTLTILGTRPEAIKLAPVIHRLRSLSGDPFVCATSQHRDMLDQALRAFGIEPDWDLQIMQDNQTPLEVAARIFEKLVPVMKEIQPDWLLVQGDTTTTLAAAWAGYHQQIPIGYVETGLRSHDRYDPFPEEMNRRLCSVLADVHFAPTQGAADHLLSEGVDSECIFVTGNTVVDALLTILESDVPFSDSLLQNLGDKVVVVTAHRRESFGEPLVRICRALKALVDSDPDLQVVFPVHPNPQVRRTVFELLSEHPRLLLVDPLPYPQFVHLMKRARLILTDSGGIQEEAPTVRTPVLILREVTERPEVLDWEGAALVGTSTESILEKARSWLAREDSPSGAAPNPFGDGGASGRIVDTLQRLYQSRESLPKASLPQGP